MPEYNRPVLSGFDRIGWRAHLRRRAARRPSPPPTARHSTSTAPRPSPSATAPSTRRSPAYPHALHYALKANSTLAIARLLRSLGSGADANSGGEIDVALRAGFIPAADRLHRRRQDRRRARAGDRPRGQDHQRRIGRRARADRRAGRARGARARAWRCASTPTSTRRAIRTSPPASRSTSSASPIDDARDRVRARCARAHGTRARRPAHPRRLADHGPGPAAPGGATRSSTLARASCATTAIAIEHLDLGGGLGISYDGTPVPTARDYAAALLPAVRGLRAAR